jgi:Cdc6-like AAA superfamily ATPase
MRLAAPVQIFREVADQLCCESVNNLDAHNRVSGYFGKQKDDDPVVLLLIDEIDCLMTANQAILYKVFDWLGMPSARLVLTAISNTMDLPERLLPRVSSRFHIERVDFEPYSRPQLHEILCKRLKGYDALDAFNDVVLRLCAARVAAASGDVRKALQISRRSVEMCLQRPDRKSGPVTCAELEVAEKELLFANPVTQAVVGLSVMMRRFLAAVVLEFRHTESADVVQLHKVASRFLTLVAVASQDTSRGATMNFGTIDEGPFDVSEVAEMAKRLEAMSILARQASSFNSYDDGFQAVALKSLDVEDLACALLRVEDDPSICQFLDSGN